MRAVKELVHVIMVGAMLASCGGYSATGPSYNPPGNGGTGGDVGGGGGGGSTGGGGSSGGGENGGSSGGGGPAAMSVTVTLGNNFFRSDRNASANPAVDTVVAGGKVTWTWVNTGTVPHNVQSVGAPSFTSGPVESASGSTYEQTFATPGSYRYNCAIHGDLMRGVIVVLAQ